MRLPAHDARLGRRFVSEVDAVARQALLDTQRLITRPDRNRLRRARHPRPRGPVHGPTAGAERAGCQPSPGPPAAARAAALPVTGVSAREAAGRLRVALRSSRRRPRAHEGSSPAHDQASATATLGVSAGCTGPDREASMSLRRRSAGACVTARHAHERKLAVRVDGAPPGGEELRGPVSHIHDRNVTPVGARPRTPWDFAPWPSARRTRWDRPARLPPGQYATAKWRAAGVPVPRRPIHDLTFPRPAPWRAARLVDEFRAAVHRVHGHPLRHALVALRHGFPRRAFSEIVRLTRPGPRRSM
jgi:hypothetical protein